MPVLSKRILDDIRSRNDIVDVIGSVVRLTKAGSAFKGLCPFHQEKTPSFHVNPGRQIFHCFGCGAGGDVFAFLMKREGLDFMGAVRQLAQKANVELEFEDGSGGGAERAEREKLYAIHAELAKAYHELLLADSRAEQARAYLASRQLRQPIAKDFQIGYAPEGWDFTTAWAREKGFPEALLLQAGLVAQAEPRPGQPPRLYDRFRDRIMFPICDEQGRVVAFSGRILKADPKAAKYVNSPETPIFRKSSILFALNRARAHIVETRTALVCEGQIDVIRCHSAGFTNAVASQGTAFTETHARIIRRFADRVVLVFDPDTAGQNAGLKTGLLFTEAGLDVRVARLPEGKDPDLLIKEKGKAGFEQVLAEARQVLDFFVEVHSAREDLRNPSGLRRVEMAAFELIRRMPDLAERESLLQRLAQRLAVNPQAVQRDFDAYDSKERARGPRAPAEPEAKEQAGAPEPTRPPSAEEVLLLEHLSADPELVPLAEAYAPAVLFQHDWSRQALAALAAARKAGEPWHEVLARQSDRNEPLLSWAAALACAPNKSVGIEFSREEAVKALILRLWVRYLKAKKIDLQRQAAGGEVDPLFYQLTGDIKALTRWDEGLAIIEAHIGEMG